MTGVCHEVLLVLEYRSDVYLPLLSYLCSTCTNVALDTGYEVIGLHLSSKS